MRQSLEECVEAVAVAYAAMPRTASYNLSVELASALDALARKPKSLYQKRVEQIQECPNGMCGHCIEILCGEDA